MELNWGDTVTAFWGLETYIVADFKKVNYFYQKRIKCYKFSIDTSTSN